jgi:hypothetical protein
MNVNLSLSGGAGRGGGGGEAAAAGAPFYSMPYQSYNAHVMQPPQLKALYTCLVSLVVSLD